MNFMLNVIIYVSFVLRYFFVDSLATDSLNKSIPKPIRGQQFTTQTTVAKLEGGPIPQDLLQLLTNNGVPPDNFIFVVPQNDSILPHLIVDEVKTVRTRLSIPLSSGYADSKQYREMLKQFLVDNQINVTKKNPLESSEDGTPKTKLLFHRLHLAYILKNNIVSILGQILYESAHNLPDNHHAPLTHIYHLLRLNRIPVIDLLQSLDKLWSAGTQEQWIIILSELEKSMPEYMKSCATFLLESLQELTLNMEQLTRDIQTSVLSKLPKQSNIILFPKNIIQRVKEKHIKTLGHTSAVMLTYFIESYPNWSPQLLALWLQHFPRNSANPIIDEVALQLIINRPTSNESAIVKNASKMFIKSDKNIFEIFNNILQNIVQSAFIGQDKYVIIQQHYQIPSDTYALNMVPMINNQSKILNLMNFLVPNYSPKTVLNAKQNISKYLLENQNSLQVYSRYSAGSPIQLMQMILFRLSVENKVKFKFDKTIFETYLYILEQKSKRPLNLMEFSVSNYLFNGNFEIAENQLEEFEKFLLNFCWIGDNFSNLSDLNCLNDKDCLIDVLSEAINKNLFKNNLCNDLATKVTNIL